MVCCALVVVAKQFVLDGARQRKVLNFTKIKKWKEKKRKQWKIKYRKGLERQNAKLWRSRNVEINKCKLPAARPDILECLLHMVSEKNKI